MSVYPCELPPMRWPRPIPYRLGGKDMCNYENAPDELVCMGDVIEVCTYTGPDGPEGVAVGELAGVSYGQDGFIDQVMLYDKDGHGHIAAWFADGVFWKHEEGE